MPATENPARLTLFVFAFTESCMVGENRFRVNLPS